MACCATSFKKAAAEDIRKGESVVQAGTVGVGIDQQDARTPGAPCLSQSCGEL
jgi:hypothetical protein